MPDRDGVMADLSIQPNSRVTFAVRHEDDRVIVVEKPSGVVSLPGKAHTDDTLLNGLFARYGAQLQQLGTARSFGLLHRLDRETSGLVLVALDASAYDQLADAFRRREVRKFYWSVVHGSPTGSHGTINRPLLEVRGEKRLVRISPAGKPALTAFRVLERAQGASLLECRTVTGRLHQLRAHLASIHCPILGDGLYGRTLDRSPRLALHAHRLAFAHPSACEVDVCSPWPHDLRGMLRRIGLDRPDGERRA